MSFLALFQNPVFMSGALGWLSAQLIKVILYTIINREFNAERIFGSGGMPSSHSATVCGLVTATIVVYGVGGFEFPMSFFFAFIVMYDAMGVRRETGKQAVVINELVDELREMGKTISTMEPMDQLKEFVGHTPLQVLAGAVLGIVIGLVVCL